MPKLRIDNREVEVEPGATILDAAAKLGIHIPTLCFLEGREPSASCMACVVKINGSERLAPACATKAADGMNVESDTDEVRKARRTALELLLGDHLGDCAAPCEGACPAHMNIPEMIRRIAAGNLRDAIVTVKRHIALPAALGRICSAPCEKACRRAARDAAVSICLLKRYVADADLGSGDTYQPECKPSTGRKAAVIGAGPTGLAAAYYLLQQGHACTVFDAHEKPGGTLRYGMGDQPLPDDLLDAEIGLIEKLGAEFRMGARIGESVSLDDLQGQFDAVLIAAGRRGAEDARALGLDASEQGIVSDKKTFATGLPGVFAAGSAVKQIKLAVRAMADGRAAAISIGRHLSGEHPTGEARPFSVHIGKLTEGEMEEFASGASSSGRVEPSAGARAGFTPEEAREEGLRCLRCDCRKRDNCKLRDHAAACDARANRYKTRRRTFELEYRHPEAVYEPGKCINCGICVRIATEAGEPLGLTFVGRGFDVRVAVPFNSSLAEGLRKVAHECVCACPTGALAFKVGFGIKEEVFSKGNEG